MSYKLWKQIIELLKLEIQTSSQTHHSHSPHSHLQTLPKAENLVWFITQTRVSQLFHFLVEPTACTFRMVMCFSRVRPTLSFHPKFVSLISRAHQMLEQSPSALLFHLCIHRTHLQQTPKEISQSSLLSLIAQFLPVSSVPFLLYGLCCYDFLLFPCPELTPKSKNWSTPISSKSHFPFHLAQSSVVVPDSTVFFFMSVSALGPLLCLSFLIPLPLKNPKIKQWVILKMDAFH